MQIGKVSQRVTALFAMGIILSLGGCDHEPDGNVTANTPPIARLSNVPPANYISQNPRLTLNWVGDDPDGYVVGFRYRWNFRLSGAHPFEYKPWETLLNIGIVKEGSENFALMTNASPKDVPEVYHYFATLDPEVGYPPDSAAKMDAGDTVYVGSHRVWASNPTPVRFPVHVNPNSGTFIFDSQDSLNPHTFEVEAIDDQGDTGAIASVYFQTPQVPPPKAFISVGPTDTSLISDRISDVFIGLPFTAQGFDPNSRTVEYSWVVDKDEYPSDQVPWSPFFSSPDVRVFAGAFKNPKDTNRVKHRLHVRARNEFGSIDTAGYFLRARIENSQIVGYDTVWAYFDFLCVYPKWLADTSNHRIMLLNASYDFAGSTDPTYPSRDSLNAYYASIFDANGYAGKYDIVNATSVPQVYFPSLSVFARYRTVFFYNEINEPGNPEPRIPISTDRMTQYLRVGGKIVHSTWSFTFAGDATYLKFGPHVVKYSPSLRFDTALVGATGAQGYPNLTLDPVKVAPFGGALYYGCSGQSDGFGEIIYKFRETKCYFLQGACTPWEGRTIGVRYDGLVYKYIYFGIPLYYCDKPTVTQVIARAFTDIGE